ncbi:MAG: efflux RND transporter periplasmic adaptor subunit [Deltaproteobacteria bacterium]|nr:efflux RND transporter periplasmic adaptor subunit [Deltaproteobacteria bacterium]
MHTPRLAALLAALATLGAGACAKKNGEDGEDAARAVPVQVERVARGVVSDVARYVGEVRPSASVNVLPRMAEKILKLGFDEGDFVTQDETVMAELATALVDTGVRQAESGADAITAQINGLKTQQERLRRLIADGVVPASQLDPIDAQIRALQAQRRQVLAGVDQANLRVEDTVVKAPMTGWVSQRFVDVGDMASPVTPLATIVRLDPVYVWVDVPEHEVEQVRRQPTAQVYVEVAPDRAFTGTVDLVSPTVDRESRSVRFRYRVDNPGTILRDGMLATVDVELQRREDVLLASTSALILDPTQRGSTTAYAAFVVRDGKAHRVAIERGLLQDSHAEVRGGLAEGDLLVVQGFNLLEEGTAVEVITNGAAPGEGERSSGRGEASGRGGGERSGGRDGGERSGGRGEASGRGEGGAGE